jgi:DNA-binding response OmpR family regulator
VRVLILEDDPFIAMDLQGILESEGHHVVGAVASVGDARPHLADGLDYALLDVDVADGKSFAIAEELQDRCIPFAFVSASRPSDVPRLLQDVDFIPKPYEEEAILRSVGERCRS